MLQRQEKLIGYLAKFLGLFGLFFYGTEAVIALSSPEGYYSSFVAGKLNFIDPFRHLLLEASRSLLSLFGFHTYFKDSLTISLVNGKGVRMVYSCIGYGVLSFWIAFVLANRAPWKKTLGWLMGGCLLLCGINIIRISLLMVAINKGWPIPFGWDHHTWFNIMAYTLIFSMIYGYDRTWKNKTLEKDNGKKQRDLTPEQREVKSLSANKGSSMEMMNTDLSKYNNNWYRPGPLVKRMLWYLTSLLFFRSGFPFSALKTILLRAFGAAVGKGVMIKPHVTIKYPWYLTVGNNSWIGERVWIDNLTDVEIGANVCLSQEAYLLTGNHNYRKPSFDLMLGKIKIEDGVWIGARAVVCPGVTCYSHAVLSVASVATVNLEPYCVYAGNPAIKYRQRIGDSAEAKWTAG